MAIALVSMSAGCASSGPSASAPIALPVIPAALTHCDRPVALPMAALSRADVLRYWARDRVALSRCDANLAAVDAYYQDLAAKLGAAKAK